MAHPTAKIQYAFTGMFDHSGGQMHNFPRYRLLQSSVCILEVIGFDPAVAPSAHSRVQEGSTARSNSVMWFGKASSRMAATMSGASVVRLTIRLT